ncbi:MAG TPA: amino acid adenylation domain-containing protein, partial [Pyrinomonadaceae bacterium]|nr:amino acid adenylation domain-containing protein [Pyrinomonadaceae bacterium]
RYETVLQSVLREPEQQLGRIEVLSAEERRELLVEWNDTQRFNEQRSFIDWFATQAQLHAEAVALVYEDKQLSFRELNKRANQLGHYLRELGVRPEIRVALCVERSVEMVVGVLGVLKAGGAYVPLEPSYPQDRLSFMVADAGVQLVLTQERYRGLFSDAHVVSLDSEWEEIEKHSREDVANEITGENLAYVIYTSGSTGVPKGVMVTHHGLSNYLRWAVDCYYTRTTEGSLVHTPLSFDLTITSLFLPLLAGEPVRLLPEAPGVEELARALRESQELGAVKLTPAHLRGLRQEFGAHYHGGKPAVMVIGGEALFAEDVQFWREQFSETRLINEYGPTETVVGCCVYEVEGGEAGAVPIGKPISNTELYVLDGAQELVPVGVKGELYIGGAGVARGYLGRAELTAERFVPNPFSSEVGARLYRTGDVVRYLADGNLEYLGRADQQVKIRGYRIELGEVEAVLNEHAGVSEAVVLARAAANGEQRLVAYVVAQNGSSSGEWREYLQERLPEYMVPAVFASLPALPLTSNGKVDRRSLPAPEWTRTRRYVPPSTEVERVLCSIWSELLGVKEVGVDDNFFELGGDSILSIQIVARAHQAGLRLTPRHMFAQQNIRELAAVVEVGEQLVLGEQGEVHGPVVLTPIQQWFFEEELSGLEHYNQAVLLRVPQMRVEWLRDAVMGLVRQHDA